MEDDGDNVEMDELVWTGDGGQSEDGDELLWGFREGRGVDEDGLVWGGQQDLDDADTWMLSDWNEEEANEWDFLNWAVDYNGYFEEEMEIWNEGLENWDDFFNLQYISGGLEI